MAPYSAMSWTGSGSIKLCGLSPISRLKRILYMLSSSVLVFFHSRRPVFHGVIVGTPIEEFLGGDQAAFFLRLDAYLIRSLGETLADGIHARIAGPRHVLFVISLRDIERDLLVGLMEGAKHRHVDMFQTDPLRDLIRVHGENPDAALARGEDLADFFSREIGGVDPQHAAFFQSVQNLVLRRIEDRIVVKDNGVPSAVERTHLLVLVQIDQGVGGDNRAAPLGADCRHREELMAAQDSRSGEADGPGGGALAGAAINPNLMGVRGDRREIFFLALLAAPDFAPFF